MKVICDAAVLIGLVKIGKLDLLKKLYRNIYIPLAKQRNLIQSIKPLFDELIDKNFRLSEKIMQTILKKAGE